MIALPSIAFEEMSGSAKGVTAAKVKSRHRHPCRLRGQERRYQRCGSEYFLPLLLRQLLHRREVGRDAGGDHLDRRNLNHPRIGSVLKTNPPCRDAGRVFRVYVRTFSYLCVGKSRLNVTMLRYSRVLLFLIIAALSGCNQYNRILEDVYDNDQAAREWTKGMSSLSADEIVEYTTEMERVDSLNQATVFGILDKEGWPYHLSEKANRAIWIVIDHSDLAYRSKYLGLVKEKAEEGVLDKTDYAILNDRVRMEEGKPQIYGTQIKMAATIVDDDIAMQLYLWPVENPAALDSLRSTVGLSPIEEYLKTSSESIGQEIVWDKEKTVADFD